MYPFEYVLEHEGLDDSIGEGLCVYLVDPKQTDWDRHFDGSGPTGFLGKKGTIIGVGIDAAGNFASKNHCALKTAGGNTLTEAQMPGAPKTPDGEWRRVKIRFDIEENKCDVKVADDEGKMKKIIDDCKFEGVTIPNQVCVGVCAGSNSDRHAHICVNDLTLMDVDDDHIEETGHVEEPESGSDDGDIAAGDDIEEEGGEDAA